MQSNKPSKKTRKVAEESGSATAEAGNQPKASAGSRSARSSKIERVETSDLGSGMHRHKVGLSMPDEPAITGEGGMKSMSTSARTATHEEIAKLAFSYWIARGYAHGSAEQDWLRAEQELSGRLS
jgi:hypothetical protein